MVKIIIKGKLPSEKIHSIKCKHCDTVFEFTEKEATLITSHRNEPSCLQIICPLCKKYCYLEKK